MSGTRVVDVTLRMMSQPALRFNLTCAATTRFEKGHTFEIVSRHTPSVVEAKVIEVTDRSNGTTSVRMMVPSASKHTFTDITSILHAMPEVTNLKIG